MHLKKNSNHRKLRHEWAVSDHTWAMNGNMWAIKSNITTSHDYKGHNLNLVLYLFILFNLRT